MKISVSQGVTYWQANQVKVLEKESFWNREITLGPSVSLKDRQQFYHLLAVLLSSGLSIIESMQVLQEQLAKKKLKLLIVRVREQLEGGFSLAESMEKNPLYFTAFEVYNVLMGEKTGRLTEILQNMALFYGKRLTVRRKVRQAMTYPIVVISIAMLVMIFMINYVVPMFQDVFKRFDAELPPVTRFILSLSNGIDRYGWIIILMVVIITMLFFQIKKLEKWQSFMAQFSLKLPIWGPLVLKLQLASFSYTFSLLIRSRIPLDQALVLMQKILHFPPLQHAILQIEQEVSTGKSLFEAMRKHAVFPTYFLQIIRVGEKTARLGDMMEKMAHSLEEESEAGVQQLTQFLEPLLIILLGGMVSVILVAMYLPMFELGNAIGS
ncbi:MAG: type II secretion system F family protein [Bacteroidota bacterium]